MKSLLTSLFTLALAVTGLSQERMILTTEAFNALEVSGNYTVFIRQGPEHEVVAMADDFDDIDWEIEDGTLEISRNSTMNWGNSPEIKLYITVTDIRYIECTGAVTVESKNRIDGRLLSIEATGASTLDLEISVEVLDLEVTGAADITLKGKAVTAQLELTGSSSVSAGDLRVEEMDIECAGAASANVYASSKLRVEAAGAATIYYSGDPEVESDVSIASELIKR